jgi:hypothetical protein
LWRLLTKCMRVLDHFPSCHLQDVFNNGLESTYVIIVQHGSMGYYVLASVDLMLSRGTKNCLN